MKMILANPGKAHYMVPSMVTRFHHGTHFYCFCWGWVALQAPHLLQVLPTLGLC